MSRRYRFEATIESNDRGGAWVDFPFDVREEFGTGAQVRVAGTVDGHEFRSNLAPMGGCHRLGLRKEVRSAIGKGPGDTVRLDIAHDTTPRTVEVPPELAAALADSDEARERYESLSFTHRREYAEWVAQAKKQETRDRRAARAVEMLIEGRTR